MSDEASERWTIGRLITWTATFLKKKGAESPRLEAEVLLAHVLKWPRVQLYTHFEDEIDDRARSLYRDLVKKRSEGMPVAYLVGQKEFFSLPLKVSPAVLIPRPDTETLVVEALERLKGKLSPLVVDVGTGSGCIALAIAERHETARVIAIDISAEALDVARSNAQSLGLADRVEFRQGDLLTPVASEGPLDMIVSNPPYIPSNDLQRLEANVRDYEPHGALDGGEDGLRVVDRLVEEAGGLLRPGCSLMLEVGYDQEQGVAHLFEGRSNWTLFPMIRDAANQPRVVRADRR